MSLKQDAMDINIHPLVIMSIADHHTRSVAQFNHTRAIGALFGKQSGREVQIYDTFDIAYQFDEKQSRDQQVVLIDHAHFEADLKLYKEAFPQYECLGWYSTGQSILPTDAKIHEEMGRYNERPLFVLLNTNAKDITSELPISVYEEEVHVVADKSTNQFVKANFKIQSDEAERITAVHCAKVVVGSYEGSSLSPHIQSLHKAVHSLKDRVQVLHTFLKDVQSGKITASQDMLRSIRGVCNRLPTMDSTHFQQDFLSEYNDALLVTYLAAMTQGEHQVTQVVDKFNQTYQNNPSSSSRGGRRRGHMDMRNLTDFASFHP